MKKFITKMQDLSKKAAELQQAVQSMPAKAAEMRQAVVMSAGELQQIRSDVNSTLGGLRANNEDGLLQAMREINDHTDLFEEAGYELTGMDLDLAITQRLAVQFKKFEDVTLSDLRALLSQQKHPILQAIFSGMIKAEETAANVELTHLQYDGLIVHVGAIPMIRMGWRSDTFIDQSTPAPSPIVAPPVTPATGSTLNPSGSFGSFFEPRPVNSPATTNAIILPTIQTEEASSTSIPLTSPPTKATAGSDWKKNALDRFKKMPDLTKTHH